MLAELFRFLTLPVYISTPHRTVHSNSVLVQTPEVLLSSPFSLSVQYLYRWIKAPSGGLADSPVVPCRWFVFVPVPCRSLSGSSVHSFS